MASTRPHTGERASDLAGAAWFTSSRSANNGACVETAYLWRKSSRSTNNGTCVETATLVDQVAVRDSKDPHGPVLVFGTGPWRAFIAAVTSGELSAS